MTWFTKDETTRRYLAVDAQGKTIGEMPFAELDNAKDLATWKQRFAAWQQKMHNLSEGGDG